MFLAEGKTVPKENIATVYDRLFFVLASNSFLLKNHLSRLSLKCVFPVLYSFDISGRPYDHGLWEVLIGVESGSQTVPNNIHKETSVERNGAVYHEVDWSIG